VYKIIFSLAKLKNKLTPEFDFFGAPADKNTKTSVVFAEFVAQKILLSCKGE